MPERSKGAVCKTVKPWVQIPPSSPNIVLFVNIIEISNQEKFEELSKVEILTEDNRNKLAKKWDISLYKLEYWIKNNMFDLYLKSYNCSKNHLIKIKKHKLKENVDNIIKNETLSIEKRNKLILELFKGNKSSLKAYIKKNNLTWNYKI